MVGHLQHDLPRLVHLHKLVEETEQAVVRAVGRGERRQLRPAVQRELDALVAVLLDLGELAVDDRGVDLGMGVGE